MRTNLPITQHEIVLGDSQLIVSKTNLHTWLTSINREVFVIAGDVTRASHTADSQWSGNLNDRRETIADAA